MLLSKGPACLILQYQLDIDQQGSPQDTLFLSYILWARTNSLLTVWFAIEKSRPFITILSVPVCSHRLRILLLTWFHRSFESTLVQTTVLKYWMGIIRLKYLQGQLSELVFGLFTTSVSTSLPLDLRSLNHLRARNLKYLQFFVM